MVASERSATTRAATSASRAIDAAERLTRLMTESLVMRREILSLLPEAFGFCNSDLQKERFLHCVALTQQRWVSMPEQADAAHAADSKEAHTDIQQSPNVSRADEVAGG